MEFLKQQLEVIRNITDFEPTVAIVLGSGLGELADEIDIVATVDYKSLPNFPVSTAPSHKGRFVFGYIGEAKVVIMQGRVHFYEGYSPAQVVMPIRLMKLMGAKVLFLTNASGGVNKNFSAGDFMVITDHITSFVPSPLIGKNIDGLGVRFPDMKDVYKNELNKIIFKVAKNNNIPLQKGTYIQLTGPNFETPAEIRMCRALGADAVGMSTATEAMAANHCGMKVCGISCIANLGCGMTDKTLTSEDVNEMANKVSAEFKTLVKESVKEIAKIYG